MQATAKKLGKVRGGFAEILGRARLFWIGATLLAGIIILLALRQQTDNCLSWFKDNHAVLLRLIGERDSGCAASSNSTECSARARRALDAMSKERGHQDPFAISDGTCAAIRAFGEAF